jgi:hypothetical protein
VNQSTAPKGPRPGPLTSAAQSERNIVARRYKNDSSAAGWIVALGCLLLLVTITAVGGGFVLNSINDAADRESDSYELPPVGIDASAQDLIAVGTCTRRASDGPPVVTRCAEEHDTEVIAHLPLNPNPMAQCKELLERYEPEGRWAAAVYITEAGTECNVVTEPRFGSVLGDDYVESSTTPLSGPSEPGTKVPG